MRAVKIAGTGSYLPTRVVTNEEIAPQLNSSPEWIYSHTGIESRHVAAPDESAASMGARAAQEAMSAAGVSPDKVGLVILATTTPDYGSYPSTACLVQEILGCKNAAAFDLAAACSGFVYGVEMAKGYLAGHPEQKALVIGSELLSRTLDWNDRSNAMLFGDGAGAVVLEMSEVEGEIKTASLLGSDGSGALKIYREAGCRRQLGADPVHETLHETAYPYLKMDGHGVFTFAVRKLDEVVSALCMKVAMAPESLDWIFPHQANLRIIDAVARRMGLPLDKFYMHLKTIGNTSSASIPLCLDHAVRKDALKAGMRIAMAGFGSGLTWAGALAQWPYL